jgi:hypothetical protein
MLNLRPGRFKAHLKIWLSYVEPNCDVPCGAFPAQIHSGLLGGLWLILQVLYQHRLTAIVTVFPLSLIVNHTSHVPTP